MRYIPAALQTHLNGSYITMCLCMKLTRRDGAVLGYTELDKDLTISAVTYRSAVGFDWASIRQASQLDDQRMQIEGLLSSGTGGITESDARLGLYNDALVELFAVNWADTSMGTIPLQRGRLSAIYPEGAGYIAELKPVSAKLFQNEVLRTIGPDCPADLGDSDCTFAATQYFGSVTSIPNVRTIVSADFVGPADPTDLIFGKCRAGGGLFDWYWNRVKSYDAGTKTFTLAVPMPSLDIVGDDWIVFEGCDKKFATCRDRFSNEANFRGFPTVPQKDKTKRRLWVYGGWWAGGTP